MAQGLGNYVHHAKGQVTRYFGQWHQDLQHGLGVGALFHHLIRLSSCRWRPGRRAAASRASSAPLDGL